MICFLNTRNFINLCSLVCRNSSSCIRPYSLLNRKEYHCLVKYGNANLNVRHRFVHDRSKRSHESNLRHKSTVYYASAVVVFTLGMSYAAVPLYRIFCQAFNAGGTVEIGKDVDLTQMKKLTNRELTISFNADVSSNLNWKFRPQLNQIKVAPGETALAFYTAENPLDRPVVGVSTYNVVPFEAGAYFNKIQCFCFEEQMLNPHEQVDMPVFFYIDPEFCEDPKMETIDNIILSYTFFEVKDGMNLPFPSYYKAHKQ